MVRISNCVLDRQTALDTSSWPETRDLRPGTFFGGPGGALAFIVVAAVVIGVVLEGAPVEDGPSVEEGPELVEVGVSLDPVGGAALDPAPPPPAGGDFFLFEIDHEGSVWTVEENGRVHRFRQGQLKLMRKPNQQIEKPETRSPSLFDSYYRKLFLLLIL